MPLLATRSFVAPACVADGPDGAGDGRARVRATCSASASWPRPSPGAPSVSNDPRRAVRPGPMAPRSSWIPTESEVLSSVSPSKPHFSAPAAWSRLRSSASRRNSGLAQRYLAIEGHRALAALDYLIPLSARRMINREIADLSASASQSLEIAVRRGPLPVPPEEFGVIRPRAVRQIAVQGEVAGLVPNAHQPRSQGRDNLRELDDDEDEALAGPDMLSSPIGGGGALGRLLKMLFRSSRSSGGGSARR